MENLGKEIARLILESGSPVKKIVGIYGGRFQPFGPHHYKTYKWLDKQVDEAYITTSNIKKPPRHPMNYKEKVRHMTKMGVPSNRIIEEKSPYVAKNLAKKYDEETTAFVYVFGAKDAGRLGGGGKYFQDYKKNKNDLKGHKHHGYYLVAPHVSMNVGGKEVSGTSMRELLGSPEIDDSEREKLFKKMFGYFNQGIFNMLTNKFKKLFKEDSTSGDAGVVFKPVKIMKKLKKKWNDDKGMELLKGQVEENVSSSQLNQVEKYLDKLWDKVGIDVEFTRHFMDRVNDTRNEKPISSAEVIKIFRNTYKKYGKQISNLGKGAQALMKDMTTNVNVPFVLHWNGTELELRAKTIMRKKNFKSSNKKFAVEAFAVRGSKVEKFITGKNLTLKGKKYKEIDFETIKIDNKTGMVTLKILSPKKLFGMETPVTFKTLRRGPFLKTDTSKKVNEDVKIPLNIGDTVLMGKFKNKKTKVKSIDWNEKGDLLINGRPAFKFRIIPQTNITDPDLKESSGLSGGYKADSGEPDTGFSAPNKERIIGKGGQPDVWFHRGGYKQLQFPKADNPYGDDTEIFSVKKVVNMPDIHKKPIESDDFTTAGVGTKGKDFVKSLVPTIIEEFLTTINMDDIIKEASNIPNAGAKQHVDDGPRYFYGDEYSYKKAADRRAKKIGYSVIDYIFKKTDYQMVGKETNYPRGPVGPVSFAPSGIAGKSIERAEQEDLTGFRFWNAYKHHIGGVAELLGFKIMNYLGASDFVKRRGRGNYQLGHISKNTVTNEHTLFSKEWWKKELLTEGGAYGHMAHPFDDKELTFGDLKKIIEDGLGGNLNREDGVTEKLDGQNIMVSWKDGKLIAARNKGHLKNAGKTALDTKGITSKFKGRGEIKNAFVFAMKDLERAIKGLSDKQKEKIFNNGYNFMNMEIMWPKSANVIDYDVATLVFHGALKYNDGGNVVGEVKGSARILAGMIKQINKHIGKKYSIGKPNFLTVPSSQDFGKLKSKFLGKLTKLRSQYGLKDTDTLGMYHQSYWQEYIYNAAQQFGFTIPTDILKNLTKRWAFFDKSYKIPTIRTDLKDQPEFLDWVLNTDKNDHAKMVKSNMKPFEVLFFEVGAEIMKNISGFIAANPDKAVQGIKKRIDKAISDVKGGSDLKKLNTLQLQMDKLNAIGGLDAIVPSEGIVFKYNGKTYKFTGAFAPINQITGLMNF